MNTILWLMVATLLILLAPNLVPSKPRGRHRKDNAERRWLDDLTAQHRAHSDRWVLA